MNDRARVLWLRSKNSEFERDAQKLFGENHALRCVDATSVSTDFLERSNEPQFICCAFEYLLLGELTLITELRKRYPHIPLILITRAPSADLAIWALRAGVHDLLCAPISPEMVMNASTSALEAHSHHVRATGGGRAVRLATHTIAFPPHSRSARVRQLQMVREQFEKNLDQPFSEVAGASLCHYSSSHFSRRFSEEFGETFARYKMKFRIDRACEMLALPTCSIAEVAALVGFSDPSYFSRVFKDTTGQTPSEYRDAHVKPPREGTPPSDAEHVPSTTSAQR